MNRSVTGVLAALVLMATAPSARAAELSSFDGRPAFREGSDRGYFVWREGDKWHVRWTTKGTLRRFTGRVEAEGGDLDSLKRIDVEEESRVIAHGRPSRVVRGPRGRVRVRGGRGPVVATREQDKIEKDGSSRITWVARTDADIDGFDFEVEKEVRSLRFVLEIEGESKASEVEVGKSNQRVEQNPFTVSVR